ncbi:putative disease resistance protein RXW24L [Sesamum alatum]|uniref:Disease resistance protein RXW24L n=1 Tax=Sesamum alatum TaxID=300844 RepID=A0AAE1Y0Y3_9LAMI|nr:putative disease resistance protein RXW24L [Sesamum alatum]
MSCTNAGLELQVPLEAMFSLLRNFSHDEEIDAEKILLHWMAEGMISSEMQGTEETLRDVAQRYLSELASRCMLQVKVVEYPSLHKRFESCRLHDLMRDLGLTKAKEEGFFGEHGFLFSKRLPLSTIKTRRLAIHFQGDVGDDFNGIEKLANLHCLYLNKLKYHEVCDIGYCYLVSNLEKFKSLRVLIFVSCDLRDGIIPSDIGYKLIHLRYFGFRDCLLDELPLLSTNFPCLQTLELEVYNSGSDMKIPNVLYKMRQLKPLFLQYVESYEE